MACGLWAVAILLGEVHAVEDGGVAGVGAERIEIVRGLQNTNEVAFFRAGFLGPEERFVFVTKSAVVARNSCRIDVHPF